MGLLFPIYGKIKAMFQTTNQTSTTPHFKTNQQFGILFMAQAP